MRQNGQLIQSKTVANIEDFTILVRCGAVQSATETTRCRSPTLLTAVFRINEGIHWNRFTACFRLAVADVLQCNRAGH